MGAKQLSDKDKEFVRMMLDNSEKKDQAKPNVITEDPKDIERLTDGIKKRIQHTE